MPHPSPLSHPQATTTASYAAFSDEFDDPEAEEAAAARRLKFEEDHAELPSHGSLSAALELKRADNERRNRAPSKSDLAVTKVMDGRESLVDELRYQIARTAHFTTTQSSVNANGVGAATFFLSEKQRHMPSAQLLDRKNRSRKAKNGKQAVDGDEDGEYERGGGGGRRGRRGGGGGGGGDGNDDNDDNDDGAGVGSQKTKAASLLKAQQLPKKELIAGLAKCGVKDPTQCANLLMVGSQITWPDVKWAFHSEGVRGLKAILLEGGLDISSISKIVARFIKVQKKRSF